MNIWWTLVRDGLMYISMLFRVFYVSCHGMEQALVKLLKTSMSDSHTLYQSVL